MNEITCQTMYPCRACVNYSHLKVLSCFNILTGLANIAINSFLIYGLWKLDLIKTTSYKFILYLCLSDCCVGLLTQPALTALLLIKDNHGSRCTIEIAAQSMQTAFCQFSVIMILIITMDRFLHMNYLTRYNTYMTKTRAFTLLILNLSTCVIIVTVSAIASLNHFYFTMHTAILTINAIILTIIFAIYSKTYLAIRKRVTGLCFDKCEAPAIATGTFAVTQEPISSLQRGKQANRKHHLNFAKAMIFVLLTLAVCYLPYFSAVTIMSHVRFKSKSPVKYGDPRIIILYWSLQLVYINSALNALIVILSSKQLRTFTWNFLHGRSTSLETTNNKRENNLTQFQRQTNRRKSRSHSF